MTIEVPILTSTWAIAPSALSIRLPAISSAENAASRKRISLAESFEMIHGVTVP
jgi:hypothetical protein